MIFALDSSCMVAALCDWQQQHAAAAREIERRKARGERMAVLAHALAETYSVLTRLPSAYRFLPADAWTAIETNFLGATLTTLDAPTYLGVLRRLAEEGTGGGRTYDALIAAAAVNAKASVLLTLNARHFHPAPPGLTIVEPA